MCLQIYIKEETGYKVSYVPNAKALTDAPPNLTVLMKQRRRWQNGALFGTAQVIKHFGSMVSCDRNDHPIARQLGVLLFMTYLTLLFSFQFLIIGATFASVYVFLRSITNSILQKFAFEDPFLGKVYDDAVIAKIIYALYLFTIFITLFMSMSVPIEKAMPCFRCMGLLFSIFSITTIVGIVFYLL
jgi:cellulose synthase/poly-beta-1,6-N-acetylglucosamine synthase-like glycosyltransferase